MGNLCADIILGQDFMERHKSVVFTFNGKELALQMCALKPMKVLYHHYLHIFLVTVKQLLLNQGGIVKIMKNLLRTTLG